MTSLWWFREEKPPANSVIPDIFQRNDVIVSTCIARSAVFDLIAGMKTGTAHSILKTLPLLDNLQEDSQKLTSVAACLLSPDKALTDGVVQPISLLFKALKHAQPPNHSFLKSYGHGQLCPPTPLWLLSVLPYVPNR